MKRNRIRITASEWAIMEVLWHQAPLSAAEVFERVAGKTSWNIGTVRAFLDRLEQKKAVKKEKAHGINVYVPLPKRRSCLHQQSRSFLEHFFQGSPMLVISHFIENEDLSEEEFKRLQQLLRQQTDKKR